jgi:uncharacterized membrane protein
MCQGPLNHQRPYLMPYRAAEKLTLLRAPVPAKGGIKVLVRKPFMWSLVVWSVGQLVSDYETTGP